MTIYKPISSDGTGAETIHRFMRCYTIVLKYDLQFNPARHTLTARNIISSHASLTVILNVLR